jgi:hypothetical protein
MLECPLSIKKIRYFVLEVWLLFYKNAAMTYDQCIRGQYMRMLL